MQSWLVRRLWHWKKISSKQQRLCSQRNSFFKRSCSNLARWGRVKIDIPENLQ
jgi:hypothetical protein